MSHAYYNEHDPKAAAWLRELIAGGHIMEGEVDERSITEVRADDLRGFTRCHFFAGIGGWDYALRLAGWDSARPVWTGSCPCQPFSTAGKQRGTSDERHLWPEFFRLIRECRPETIFGEQVASPVALDWLDAVSTDLEAAGYAFGSADLCAAGVGAPHIRQRLYWVGKTLQPGLEGQRSGPATENRRDGAVRPVAEAGESCGVADAAGQQEHEEQHRPAADERGWCADKFGGRSVADAGQRTHPTHGFWRDPDWLLCRDGKWRPVESGTFPLAHGVPGRVGLLRGYGNAIVPQVAAEFVKAFMSR